MARAKRKKKKINWRTLTGVVVLIVVVVLGALSLLEYIGTVRDDSPNATEMREVVIERGARTADIATELKKSGIIRYPLFFRMVSRLGGHDATFKQGAFLLTPHMGYEDIFATLSDPANGQNNVIRVTIPEGFELRQIADRLEEMGLIDREIFYDVAKNEYFDYDFIRKLPKRENRLEGYLFPDTYAFVKDSDTEQTIINTMLARFNEVVYTSENQMRAKELGMSMDEVVTLASIVEREAMGESDRKDVSSVFHNRLKSSSYPYLQSCATVQYILKERKTVLSEADTKIQSPYNTYQNKGLPVGPIASPGLAAVEAALYPNQTDYLFFVLGADGVHHFSKTYEEHLANMP